MPYISSEEVKAIRQKINAIKGFKFSVTKRHHSGVLIQIKSGPIDFGTTDSQVNHYYIERDYKDNIKAAALLLFIKEIVETTKPVTSREDSDYGSIPNYYLSIHIGSFEKPYEITC